MICLQHRVLLLPKHDVHLLCILFVNFLLTLPFSINLVPLMSLRFLFRRKAETGGFCLLDLGLYAEDADVS